MDSKLGAANVYSWFGVMLPFAVSICLLIFGFAIIIATVILLLVLAIGLFCSVLRAVYLLKNVGYASSRRVIIEMAVLVVSILISCLVTDVRYIPTATGFILEQQRMSIFIFLIAILNFVSLILQAMTNQKLGKEYFRQKNGVGM